MASAAPVNPSPRAGRRAYLNETLRGRNTFWVLFAGIGGSVLLAAMWRDVRVALAGPLLTGALVVFFAYRSADRRSELDFFTALAPTLGLAYLGEIGVVGITPLLAAGDRRHFQHVMGAGGTQLGMYTYEVRRQNSNRGVEHWDKYAFTVCVIDLSPEMPSYPGVYVCRKRGLIHGDDWLRHDRSHRVELESIAFNERYDLLRASDQDELALRELLSPTLIEWLAGHPLRLGFELRGGVLASYVPGHIEGAGQLAFFLDGARHLAAAATRQADQAGLTRV